MPGQSSQEIFQQLQQMGGETPNFQQEIAKAYDAPVLRPIVNEAAQLQGQQLSALFDPFTKMGTGAQDMSPAAKLAAIGGSMGRLGGRIAANNSIQDFYGAQIGNLANNMTNQFKDKRSYLQDLYSMAFQREQADQAAKERAQQLRMMSAGYGGGGQQPMPGSAPVQQNRTIAVDVPDNNVVGGLLQEGGTALGNWYNDFSKRTNDVNNSITNTLGLGNLIGNKAGYNNMVSKSAPQQFNAAGFANRLLK